MGEEVSSLFEYKGWNIVGKIGQGSFATVYEIEREDFGYHYKAALKVIRIPQSEQDLSEIKNNIGKSEDSLEAYYQCVASDIVKEFELMYRLRGTSSNIVSYEDHEIQKHKDGIGWDILIRMELLTPFESYIRGHPMTRKDVIQLGIDICRALEKCQMFGIIHRDIKPGNICVSDQGDFKLGDFGIARTIEAHDAFLELSHKGTINYMAPEVNKGMNYSFDVDLYSLGIVMYRLLNNNTLPFVPLPPYRPNHRDIANANQRRFKGEAIPYPVGDNTQLADIVLKACAYCPEDRYQSPKLMREHLEMVLQKENSDDPDDRTVLIAPGFLAGSDRSISGSQELQVYNGSSSEHSGSSEISVPMNEILDHGIERISLIKKILIGFLASIGLFIIIIFLISAILPDIDTGAEQDIETEDLRKENLNLEEVPTKEGDPIQEETTSQKLQDLIAKKDFVASYKLILDGVENGENLDPEIQSFVQACKDELEYKRVVAAMKLLSDNISGNESFYRETINWFYGREKDDMAQQIIADLRNKGTEGVTLADILNSEHSEYMENNNSENNENNEQ